MCVIGDLTELFGFENNNFLRIYAKTEHTQTHREKNLHFYSPILFILSPDNRQVLWPTFMAISLSWILR